MNISFELVPGALALEAQRLTEEAPSQTSHFYCEELVRVNYCMENVKTDAPNPLGGATIDSPVKRFNRIARIVITPPNDKLKGIIIHFFNSQKIPASKERPESLYWDSVFINNEQIIG